ncbi:MAG TPA: hypothetical protein VI564_09505 [Candidatus Nanoarchaeia archaeon]|nr:hypothetical protein [Candidatus Nanoarchaeia archaeon]
MFPLEIAGPRLRHNLVVITLVLMILLILGILWTFIDNSVFNSKATDFEADSDSINAVLKPGESTTKRITVSNRADDKITLNLKVDIVSDYINSDSYSLDLEKGHGKIINLNLSSYLPDRNTVLSPGVYVGKLLIESKKSKKEIPIVIEVESDDVLFDVEIAPVLFDGHATLGSDLKLMVSLFSFEPSAVSEVLLNYEFKDLEGNNVITEGETIVSGSQASFFKNLPIPTDIRPGTYLYSVKARYANSIGTSSTLIDVQDTKLKNFSGLCRFAWMCNFMALIAGLLAFSISAFIILLLMSPKKQKEPKEIPSAKRSRDYVKCLTMLHSSRLEIQNSNIGVAKKDYMDARNIYMKLEYSEKKDIYAELQSVYGLFLKLSKKQ